MCPVLKKTEIDAFTCAGEICKALSRGVLLTTRSGSRVNTMTIGWGTMGVEWGKPIFIAYVRESRYTRQLLEESGEFTVNIPLDGENREILGYCGRKSGRDTDKFRDMALTAVDSDVVSAPGIAQFPLTLECRILYRQEQDARRMPREVIDRYYPPVDEQGRGDMHTAYYGEIVNAYRIDPD